MKATVSSHSFVESFRACGRETQFTRAALFALFAYLESYEEDCGVEIELDPIGICCEWAEYSSALDWLREKTQVVEFEGGLVVQQF